MSSLYNVEPPPTAKVILYTTSGEIQLELFAQQTPRTCRNFLQLCLDGYYDRTIFHRLVPGFVLQGGDPTGTGSGGESSYDGKAFEDEFHQRLKFNRRGLLGMANTGVKNDNGSQFFLTLGKTEELQGKNTMFGRVEGNTIFNLLKMGDTDLDGEDSERPMYPTMITSTEILVNPFEGLVKRTREAERTVEKTQPKKKPKKKAGKQILSFGGDEEDQEAPVRSAARFNPKLVKGGQDPIPRPSRPSPTRAATEKRGEKPIPVKMPVAPSRPNKYKSPSASPSPSPSPEPDTLAQTNAQIANLTKSMKRSNPTPIEESGRKKTALEAMRPATATKGRKRGAMVNEKDERKALADFKAFQLRLEAVTGGPQNEAMANGHGEKNADPKPTNKMDLDEEDEEAALCDLHFIPNCESCKRWNEEGQKDDDDVTGEGLMGHTLSFAKERRDREELKRRKDDELVLIDPRERAKEFKAERKKK
ncbi:MAG: Peptidyl-prolyl isomerase cwc27 [Alyxoria varia]|nr:MAG: Peptidyl-prolyl isomerase cwc27 [Alyxoria varia]